MNFYLLTSFVLFLTSLLKYSESVTCKSIGNCACELSNGKGVVDLSPLMKLGKAPLYQNIKSASGVGDTFRFDPCRKFICSDQGQTQACAFDASIPVYIAIGDEISYQYDDTDELLTFVYKQETYTTYVNLQCDSSVEGAGTLKPFDRKPPFSSKFYTSLVSKLSCPVKKNHNRKLSVGTILCITFIVLVVCYVIGGILINKYVRKSEDELFPNKSFWTGLSGYVKDGCGFTMSKITSGKKEEYEQI